MAQHFHSIPVAEVRREADDAVSVCFAVPDALRSSFAFRPGQHLTLKRDLDGEEQRRSYSLCAGVDDGEWRIGIRELPGGRFSTWANRELRVGDVVEVMPPDGAFCLDPDPAHARHVVLIGAGSGITPLLSIAKSVLAREPDSTVSLVYGNRTVSSMMFREALEDLKDACLGRFALYHVFSREPQEAELFEGRLDAARLGRFLDVLLPPATIDEVYLCGPSAMLDALVPTLIERGIGEDRVHVERFGTDSLPAPTRDAPLASGPEAEVSVIADGLRREFRLARDGDSILDAARAVGLDLPFACKSGVCATCRARLTAGTVAMDRNFALMKRDLAAGFILSCQAHPTSDRVCVDFDDR
ncbi:MAG: phenylacetate-CoA oxygenase/reductase subunit PaaK [Acidobacteria bacterium]|nr:phenylacetate-CoA oxygenase/reductase subunit PaaK [Acidobacteriota bacterium]